MPTMPAANSSSSSTSDAALRLPIFGADVERGCFVKTVDFTKHVDKANAPPDVVELHNEKELLEHLSWTYQVNSSRSNTAAAGGDDKAPQQQLPHDVLSV